MISNSLPIAYSKQEQQKILYPLFKLLDEHQIQYNKDDLICNGCGVTVLPTLVHKPEDTADHVYYSTYDITEWLPQALLKLK